MAQDKPDNIKAFNYIVLSVLTKLYSEFPQPTDIKGLRFVIEAVITKGAEAAETRFAFLFSPTMMWLKEEGFIKFEKKVNHDEFKSVTLTLRGLTVLGYVPKSLFGPKKTLIQRAKHVLDKGVGDAAAAGVKTVVSEALRLMVQLPGSPIGL